MIGRPKFHRKETSKRRLLAVVAAWAVSATAAYYLGSEWRACVRPQYLVAVEGALHRLGAILGIARRPETSSVRGMPQFSLLELSSSVLAQPAAPGALLSSPAASTSGNGDPAAPWPYETCTEYYRTAPYQWASHISASPQLADARLNLRQPTDAELEGTAIVTMATGDAAARGATALMQSLIDSGTRVPTLLILVFRGGHGSKWCDNYPRKMARRGNMDMFCGAEQSSIEDAVSPEYLLAWERMGVKYQLLDPLPGTNWTMGDRATWWGMAWNKLRVFHLVQYKKLLWLDGDTIVFHNIDHLLLQPTFTAAFMQECDLTDSYGKTAGSTWVVEPDWEVFHSLERLFDGPVPNTNPPDKWEFGDMQLVAYAFGQPNPRFGSGTNLPWTYDKSQALMPGLREFLPEFRAMSDGQWKAFVYSRVPKHFKARLASLNGTLPPEGLWPEYDRPFDRSKPIWLMLDVRYEAIAPNCAGYGAGRDLGPDWFNVHFTCMLVMNKPADYTNEYELLSDAMTKAPICLRYYVLRWYEIYVRGMGARLPPPYYNGTLELPRELHPAARAGAP